MADNETIPVKSETQLKSETQVKSESQAKSEAQPPARKAERLPVAEKPVEKTAETPKAVVEAAATTVEMVKEQAKESVTQVVELSTAAVEAQRSAVQTVVEAARIYGEGLQGIAHHVAEAGRAQFEETISYLRSLAGVKSVKEALDLQSDYARATASRALTEASTLAEDYLRVATKALQPVTIRARETAERVKKAA